MKKTCLICGQKLDLYTTVHKKSPFVNNKNYDIVCFTCFFVPKIEQQTYKKDGSVLEEIQLPYSCESLCEAKDLLSTGAAETLKQAKISVEAVKKACKGTRILKKPIFRPKPEWNIA